MDFFKRIKKFNKDAGTQLGQSIMLPADALNEIDMLQEEVKELETTLVGGLVPYVDSGNKRQRKAESVAELRIHVADAIGDIVYVAAGLSAKLGMDFNKIMEAVCTSNETKYTDGVLAKNLAGKIQKGTFFKEPDLSFTANVEDLTDE